VAEAVDGRRLGIARYRRRRDASGLVPIMGIGLYVRSHEAAVNAMKYRFADVGETMSLPALRAERDGAGRSLLDNGGPVSSSN